MGRCCVVGVCDKNGPTIVVDPGSSVPFVEESNTRVSSDSVVRGECTRRRRHDGERKPRPCRRSLQREHSSSGTDSSQFSGHKYVCLRSLCLRSRVFKWHCADSTRGLAGEHGCQTTLNRISTRVLADMLLPLHVNNHCVYSSNVVTRFVACGDLPRTG